LDPFKTLSEATWILGNTFDGLESEEINSMKSIAPIRTVGPLIPSAFLDGRNPEDTDFGAHLWKITNCMDWLNTKEPASVVYVSFGSITVLSKEQTQEIALGLKASGHSFIWVIRPSSSKEDINSEENLPEGFLTETSWQGLVVPWCPQLQVLSHASIGAFMTHCGWNSTLESLSFGVPLLALPQWSDQTTNSLYISEKWKTGLRVNKRSADGLVGKEDVEKCIKMVMESELGVELRENALRWKKLSREAMGEAGSSNENIEEFVEDIVSRASSMSLSG
jgi:pathogen-inducible salicylic acid glucosyltransferase